MAGKTIQYFDPKNDLTFRKIFGEHPHILIGFLNNLLFLSPDQQIETTEYFENEIMPDELKNERLIKETIDCVQKDAFSEGELLYSQEYYWVAIRTEKAALEEAMEKNKILGKQKEEA